MECIADEVKGRRGIEGGEEEGKKEQTQLKETVSYEGAESLVILSCN